MKLIVVLCTGWITRTQAEQICNPEELIEAFGVPNHMQPRRKEIKEHMAWRMKASFYKDVGEPAFLVWHKCIEYNGIFTAFGFLFEVCALGSL
jgi:hypothetical protein